MPRPRRLAVLLLAAVAVMAASIAPNVAAWGRRWPHQVAGPLAGPGGSPPGGVPFLTGAFGEQARITVEAAFGADLTAPPNTWNWYDITGDVRYSDGQGVNISPLGRSDETSTAQPAGATLELGNDSGDYTANNPNGRWWPYVRRNTPLRVSLNLTGCGADTSTRFQGEVTSWTPSWDASANLAVVTVTASGETRRLQQGKSPKYSALYRAIKTDTVRPVAWWPMEDGAQSTRFVSGLPAGAPLTVQLRKPDSARPSPGAVTPPTGVTLMPSFSGGGSLRADVAGTTSQGWTVEAAGYFGDTEPEEGNYTPASIGLVEVFNAGAKDSDYHRWSLSVSPHQTAAPSGGITLTYFDLVTASGSVVINDTLDAHSLTLWDKATHHFVISMQDAGGGSTAYRLLVDGVLIGSGTVARAMFAVGPVVLNGAPWTGTAYTFGLGELAIYAGTYDLTSHAAAAAGHVGETATRRLVRLCDENGIALTVIGDSDTTMGPQGADPLPTLLREPETADGGVLHDGRSAGLTYITRAARYNQAPALTADMAAEQVDDPFSPVDDDQRVRNVAKVDRKGGSSATVERSDGPLGTDTIGVYDTQATLNVDSDDILDQYAAWAVHVGTVQGFRYPQLHLDLAATPALAAAWLAAEVGNRIDVVNITSKATQHPPDDVALMLEGWSEGPLSPLDWTVTANASPYQPWIVGVVEGSGEPLQPATRVDTDGSSLAAGVDATATSLSVASAGVVWTTTATFPADFPFDVELDGERVSVTAIVGASSPQTFTVTRSVNGVAKAHPAGTTVSLWRPAVIAL